MKCKKSLMGAAAILILIFHFWMVITASPIETNICKSTYIGVDIFFFVSAYSISNRKQTSFISFITNRLLYVYMPFVAMAILAAIYKNWSVVKLLKVVSVAISLICSIYFIVKLTKRIVSPLKKLTIITGQYAKGNWGDKFVSDTEDEIQELSESILIMAETTKSYIDMINNNAMTDSLTGLKNKNCYLSYINKYKEGNDSCDKEYAIVVFDLNFLKKANDEYGHEMGDKLIKLAGQHICKSFPHSPVFRIGGDEYTAILEGESYGSKEKLCRQFEKELKNLPPVEKNLSLSISYGVACNHIDGATYDEVFKCADERMYEYKKKMKAERK